MSDVKMTNDWTNRRRKLFDVFYFITRLLQSLCVVSSQLRVLSSFCHLSSVVICGSIADRLQILLMEKWTLVDLDGMVRGQLCWPRSQAAGSTRHPSLVDFMCFDTNVCVTNGQTDRIAITFTPLRLA